MTHTIIPPGFALVPIEPTTEMKIAMHKANSTLPNALGWEPRVYAAAIAAAPVVPSSACPPLPEGWKFNHAQQQTDEDGAVDGVWEIGYLDPEDDRFSPIVTVDTGLYYQDKQAEPLARAILARLAG